MKLAPDFDAFRGDFTPTSDTREHMLAEVQRMARYYSVDAPASFDTFFSSDRSFAENQDIADIYGVSVWSGGEPPALPDERQGITTRALLLSSGSATTHPIMKGVFLRKAILCDEVPPPPGDAMAIAQEQRRTHLHFQPLDAARQRRLGDVQRRGRLDETAVLLQGEQVVQLAQFDGHVGGVWGLLPDRIGQAASGY